MSRGVRLAARRTGLTDLTDLTDGIDRTDRTDRTDRIDRIDASPTRSRSIDSCSRRRR
ncbi:hypothetical protein [Haloferax sp. Atlit-12N]|uniref:hypothetical protein n=1 Tax=Haloferax sp. Atlit-12N TaxID=2077203 RepID=UPI0013147306|nr:hypothetical protein [Haloferax sp. Atlit-12N]